MSDQTQELPLGLYWKNKRTEVERIVLPFQNLEVIETINESRATREREKGTMFKEDPAEYLKENKGWRNKLIWGDNKYVMSALLEKFAGKIDLIYIDPPFATGADFSTKVEIGEKEIETIKEASAIEEVAYRDTWGKGLDSFLQMIYDRLVLMRELLSNTGSIYVHLDHRLNSHVRILMDEIFGLDYFRNLITWKRTSAHSDSGKFGNNADYIIYYTKSSKYQWNQLYEPYTEEYLQRFERVDKNGKRWTDGPLTAKGLSGGGYEYTYKGVKGLWRCPIETMKTLDGKGDNAGVNVYGKHQVAHDIRMNRNQLKKDKQP